MGYLYLFILSVVIAWIRLLCTRCCCNNNHLYPAKPARRKATRAGNFGKTPTVFGNYMLAEISRRHWLMVIRETETARSRNRAGKLRGKWLRLEFIFSIVVPYDQKQCGFQSMRQWSQTGPLKYFVISDSVVPSDSKQLSQTRHFYYYTRLTASFPGQPG